jgi:hypothetical protein
MKNQELQKYFDDWAASHGINKGEGVITVSDADFGGLLPKPVVEELIDMTRSQSRWLGSIRTLRRTASTGTFPILDLNEPVTEYVGENDGTTVTNKPNTSRTDYACKKFRSDLYITTEDLQEAAAAGLPEFEQKVTAAWATQLGNDIATLVMQGDSSLLPTTRLNKLLRGADGIDKITSASSIVYDAAGKAFDQGIFAAMLDMLPERYAEDPGLKWMFNRRTNLKWKNSLTNVSTTERTRSILGDQVLTTFEDVPPLGVPQLIVPQITSTQGGTPIAPDTVAGTTEVTATVPTLLPNTTNSAGRKVKITCVDTGVSEICTVTYPGSVNTIVTAGKLGQATVSGTASHYTVVIYDYTSLYLQNPLLYTLIYCYDWRSYREFNKDFDRYEVTTYFQMAFKIPTPEVIVKFKNVRVTPITW